MKIGFTYLLNLLTTGSPEQNLQDSTGGPFSRINRLLQYTAFFILLFGLKLWVIQLYGNATPFYDQWDAEGKLLYSPYLNGDLHFKNLFNAHNEHRIFTTRLLALAELIMNKIWNPLFQMVVNACIHIIALIITTSLISRVTGRNTLASLLAFSLVLFGIPYAWENTLCSFQVQFYLVLFFSIIALWLLTVHEPLSKYWWAGVVCGMLAFLSMASGIFVYPGATAIILLMYFFKLRKTNKQLYGAAILIVLFVIGYKLTPVLPAHDELRSSSFSAFYTAMVKVMGWPIASGFIAALIRNLPLVIFAVLMIWKRPPANDVKWFLLGLVAWVLVQNLSMAYARGLYILSSRYKDLHAFTILVDFACLVSLAQTYFNTKWRKLTVFSVGAWIGIVLVSLSLYSIHYVPVEIAAKREFSLIEEKNTKGYVATSDINYLKKPLLEIPHPSTEVLAADIEMPGVRDILPANLGSSLKATAVERKPESSFIAGGYYFTTPKRLDPTWGSYTQLEDGAMGEMELRFHTNLKGTKIEIPVAGYPLKDGIKLEIVQNGQRSTLPVESNPGESWGAAYAKITSSDFSIRLTDSSTTTWLAIAEPHKIGRFDGITTRLLEHYYALLIIGVAIVVFLITFSGLHYRKQG
jgi:hypothetical protein